jgi:NTP pyrophosphatase (non-canonical NTP hydrolase)
MKKLSEQIADHHLEEFGDVELNVLMVKLMEEVGEVASDVYRFERTWDEHHADNAVNEIGDVLIVLTMLCNYLNADIETIYKSAAERFLNRTWD